MRRWRSSILLVAVAAVSLAQSSSGLVTPAVARVGSKLACLCGTCNNTVADCPMIECGYSKPAREKIAAMQAAGSSDAEIIASFVQEQGTRALAVPPTQGFNLLAWVMPFVALAAGLGVVWLFIKRFHPKHAIASAPDVDPGVLERYHDRIEKDLAKLD